MDLSFDYIQRSVRNLRTGETFENNTFNIQSCIDNGLIITDDVVECVSAIHGHGFYRAEVGPPVEGRMRSWLLRSINNIEVCEEINKWSRK
jgi:hypothetical protein